MYNNVDRMKFANTKYFAILVLNCLYKLGSVRAMQRSEDKMNMKPAQEYSPIFILNAIKDSELNMQITLPVMRKGKFDCLTYSSAVLWLLSQVSCNSLVVI
ncbi:hypothetical protein T4B_2710 [Trichinella pseudospiralis]|uniref:Uncharacterized protein n=1 Tax=Trichinella pseudospiralis TaxID=6337 RepID=A0A0V1IAX5_TRIPS|nr:hypothetical protein T4A_5666 [Trichinella pseudospiralis]KRZ19996.1 hypothetical protein T4B_2710 [Trichinella pseudospiralis]KRZ41894.1 hypothetical protein T4C_4562 [Trichinella pseudospiralis]